MEDYLSECENNTDWRECLERLHIYENHEMILLNNESIIQNEEEVVRKEDEFKQPK